MRVSKLTGLLVLVLLVLVVSCSRKEKKQVLKEDASPAELLQYGDKFYSEQDYENAFIAYSLIYHNHPSSREYIDASIGLARCYGAMKDFDKEFDLLYNLLRENIIPSKVPSIYNAIAEFYERSAGISAKLTGDSQGDYQTAIKYLQQGIAYPNSDDKTAKSLAQYKIGILFDKMNEYAKAIDAFQKTITNYPETKWANAAQAKMTEVKAKMERHSQLNHSQAAPQTEEKPMQQTATTDSSQMPAPQNSAADSTQSSPKR